MAEYLPPTENLPVFDVTVFRNDNPYSDIYLARKGIATSEAISTSFSGEVNFNNISTPPHCSATPIDANDLANKGYVDALAPKTAYIVYLNWTQTYTTPTPTIYKKLSVDQVQSPTTVALATTNLTPVLVGGFFNSKAALQFADVIPAGNWNLVLYANCGTATDQNHLELNYTLVGVTAGGVETVIATSAYSNTINVIAPSIGTYACNLTLPSTSILAYSDIGIKVYVKSNINANRDGSIFFQYASSYSSLQTSFATTQASNILTTNNTWTGTNIFNNTATFSGAINLNSPVIQTGTITFPDTTTQSTAYKSLTTGSYTNTNIVVDANGAISSIANGTVPSTNAVSIDLTNTTSGTPYYMTYSTTNGAASVLRAGGVLYNRDANFISASCSNSTNLLQGSAGQIPYQSAPQTTQFIAVGTAGQVLKSNATGAPTWTNDILGNSATSSAVALTADNTAGDWYIPFSKTTSATDNTLYIDNGATPLTYNANTGVLSATEYSIGGSSKVIGSATASIYQISTVNTVYIGWATGGKHRFFLYTGSNVQVNPLNINSGSIDALVPLNVVASGYPFTVKDGGSVNQIYVIPSASGGAFNALVQGGDQVLAATGTVGAEVLTLTAHSPNTNGLRISANSLVLGAGGTGLTPTTRISIDGAAGTLALTSTTCPTQTGYTVPAGSDSSSNIATTAWVQSAIPLGTSALATNVSGGVIGNVLYQASAGNTTRMTNGAAGTVLTSGGVGAIPTWSADIAGNAGSATKALLSNTAAGATNYLVMSATSSGNSDLLTDTSGATYDSTTNTAVINITGNSATTTNMTGGVIGNVLYQGGAGSTTRMTNGAAGTILTSGGVGAIPTWSSTFSGTSTNATNAVNTGITNDTASATYHAITFVSNTTGNLPQKTRANVSTGDGLTYIPSTNTLNCGLGGVGTVSTSKLTVKDNLGDSGDIFESGGQLNIRNNSAGNALALQTADLGTGTIVNRMTMDDTSIVALEPIEPRAGIISPTTALTYTTDMIGYSTTFVGSSATFTSGIGVNTVSTVTIGVGVWLIFGLQVIVRGTGVFPVTSFTQQSLTIASGAGSIFSPGQMLVPIPSGYTGTQINSNQSATVKVTSAATINSLDTTTMTVGTATRSARMVFTRIA